MSEAASAGRGRALLMALPMLLLVGACFVVPLAWIGRISFYASHPGGVLVPDMTLDSYGAFLGDAFYREMVVRTLLIAALVTVLALLLTYPIALFLHRTTSAWWLTSMLASAGSAPGSNTCARCRVTR